MEHTALNGTTTATNHDWKEKKGYTSLVVFVALLLGLAFYAGQIRGMSLAVAGGGTTRDATASLWFQGQVFPGDDNHKSFPGLESRMVYSCPDGPVSCFCSSQIVRSLQKQCILDKDEDELYVERMKERDRDRSSAYWTWVKERE